MHTKSILESDGSFKQIEQKYDCPHCKSKNSVSIKIWESSCGGYEDEKNSCEKCGKIWWVEGIDS